MPEPPKPIDIPQASSPPSLTSPGPEDPPASAKHERSKSLPGTGGFPFPGEGGHSRQSSTTSGQLPTSPGSYNSPTESLISRLSKLGFSPPRSTSGSISKLYNGGASSSAMNNGDSSASESGTSPQSTPSTSPSTSSLLPSIFPKSPSSATAALLAQQQQKRGDHDGVERAFADSSAEVGGGGYGRAGADRFASEPRRRASIGPSMLFGTPAGGPDKPAGEPSSPPAGLGIFRRMSISGGFARPALAALSTSAPGPGDPFSRSPPNTPYPSAPPPTPQTASNAPLSASPYNDFSKQLPPVDEKGERERGRPVGPQRKSSRQLSPMSRRMLRGPFHE